MPKKKWTVVAFYEDNLQPYICHVSATSPSRAADLAMQESDSIIRVVEVFQGSHDGTLGNNQIL